MKAKWFILSIETFKILCIHIIYMVVGMPNMTISVPDDLYEIMKKHREIKWSEIARRAMWEYAKKLELLDSLLENSELTDEDVSELAKKIKKGIAERHEI